MARNERGFTTLVVATLIVTSLGGWKFGTLLAKGPTTEKDYLDIAYVIEAYVREQVEVNKRGIETTIDKAREIGKQQDLSIVYSYETLGIYNVVIYLPLGDRTVKLHDFNVRTDKGR